MGPEVVPMSVAVTAVILTGLASLVACIGCYAKGRVDERKELESNKSDKKAG